MSSGKLDQSLDEILSTQRKAAGRRSTRRPAGRPTPTAPAGGVKKNVKPARNTGKSAPAKAQGLVGESKIVVSNMVSNIRYHPFQFMSQY
jgi:THO complex subunit 4